MANIPTFNNLDLMEDVRVQSLNPVIVAVNDLVNKSATTAQLRDTNFRDNEVPRWDATTKSFEPAGVWAQNGEITMSPNTLIFGNHEMSSGVENVIFLNKHSGRTYAPVWQEVGASSNTASLRAYGKIEQVVRVPMGSIDVTNPVNRNVQIDEDELFVGGTINLAKAATNVVLEIYDSLDNQIVWKQDFGDMQAGSNSLTFKTPVDLRKGYTYDVKLYSSDGSDVVAKSNTNDGFSWIANRCRWKDRDLAIRADLGNLIEDVELVNGETLRFTPWGDSAPVTNIKLPLGSYIYKGSKIPSYPTEPQLGYFIDIEDDFGMTNTKIITTPEPSSMGSQSGKLFYVRNNRVQGDLQIEAPQGDTVDGTASHLISPQDFGLFARVGTDWKKILGGWLPGDYNSVLSKISESLTKQKDGLNDIWAQINALKNASPSGVVNIPPKTVISVSKTDTGYSVQHFDGSTEVIPFPTGGGAVDLAPLNTRLASVEEAELRLEQRLGKDESIFDYLRGYYFYSGKEMPKYPTDPVKNYFLTFTGMKGDLDITLPVEKGTLPFLGSVVFIRNISGIGNVNITSSDPTITVDSKSLVVGPGGFTILGIANGSWNTILSGWLASDYVDLINNLKSSFAGQLNSMDAIDREMAKRGYTKGVVPGGGGSQGGQPSDKFPEFWGSFGTTWPRDLVKATRAVNDVVQVTKDTDSPQRAFIIINKNAASKVVGMAEGEGLPSLWSSTDILYPDGETYRVYVSPRSMYESKTTFKLTFTKD